MLVLRAYKTELDPNDAQRTLFVRYAGASRFIYNWALADRIERYKAGLPTTHYEQKKRFNALKHEQFPWLEEVSYRVVEQAFANLDRAYQNFFRRVKAGDAKVGFPRFKSRHRGLGGFTLRDIEPGYVEATRIRLPRIGWVGLKEHGYLPTQGVKILSANISEKADRWFISMQVAEDCKAPVPATGPAIGVDLGIKTLATCSDGTVFENPRSLARREKRLARLQRELCRKVKGSKNREKSKRKVAKLHARIANIRRDTIHKATHYLTTKTKPSTVVIEDLNVAGMVKNHSLSKAISDAAFAEFRRQLTYKAQWYGVDLVIADRFYPSSKTCSGCGTVKPLLRLSERRYVCEACGLIIDRDLNAAINLAGKAGKSPVSACGEGSFTAQAGCLSGKQEPSRSLPATSVSESPRSGPSQSRVGM